MWRRLTFNVEQEGEEEEGREEGEEENEGEEDDDEGEDDEETDEGEDDEETDGGEEELDNEEETDEGEEYDYDDEGEEMDVDEEEEVEDVDFGEEELLEVPPPSPPNAALLTAEEGKEDSAAAISQGRMVSEENVRIGSGNEFSDASTCPICMEPWSASGMHRTCCLPCGHVYGRRCIERWIKQCGRSFGKCPQCNKEAKLTEIRNLYMSHIVVADEDLQKEVVSLRSENEFLKKEKAHLDKVVRLVKLIREQRIKASRQRHPRSPPPPSQEQDEEEQEQEIGGEPERQRDQEESPSQEQHEHSHLPNIEHRFNLPQGETIFTRDCMQVQRQFRDRVLDELLQIQEEQRQIQDEQRQIRDKQRQIQNEQRQIRDELHQIQDELLAQRQYHY